MKKIHSTSYLVLDDDADNKIISILSICASSIQLEETKSTSVFPAVELKLFGVDHNYQGKKIAPDNEAKYSELIFNWLISYIKSEICERINVEYLVLFSVPDDKTIGFYNKMGLKKLNDNFNLYNSTFARGCIPMYLKL
ncbi:MAG: hypothetical protein PUB76_08030 [Oscillospiraceae bacterium]|nr:hypothetical protein [Oscillospiraceae bacterium]